MCKIKSMVCVLCSSQDAQEELAKGPEQEQDDWDLMIMEDEEAAPVPAQPGRSAGIDFHSDDEKKPPTKRVQRKGGKQPAASQVSTTAPSSATASFSKGKPNHEDGGSSTGAGKKHSISSYNLDEEMKFVAQKYATTGSATSFSSLEGLKVESFLSDMHPDERPLSAMVRGVPNLESLENKCLTVDY